MGSSMYCEIKFDIYNNMEDLTYNAWSFQHHSQMYVILWGNRTLLVVNLANFYMIPAMYVCMYSSN